MYGYFIPTVRTVHDGVDLYNQNDCDLIVAVGGGSPIDCAKGIGLVAANGGSIKDFEGLSIIEAADLALESIKRLSKDVGIPSGLKELGAKEEDMPTLADNALIDACGLTNPRIATKEDIIQIYKTAM